MMVGETAWIWASAPVTDPPGLSRPMIDSHQAVREEARFLPGGQNIGSEQIGRGTAKRWPISRAKNWGALAPMMGKIRPSKRTVRLVIAGSWPNSDCQKE